MVKCVCLVFHDIAVKKVSNITRYYETLHKSYNTFTGKSTRKLSCQAEINFNNTIIFFLLKSWRNGTKTGASYEVSKLIAERMKPFTDREFFKEILLKVAEVVCPEKKRLLRCVYWLVICIDLWFIIVEFIEILLVFVSNLLYLKIYYCLMFLPCCI